MASFFLNIRDGDTLIRDPEAYQFASAEEARAATIKLVREMLRQRDDDLGQREIEIADATGHPVAILRKHDVTPERCH